VKGWRVQAGVGTNRAIIDSTIVRPIFYNDQFNTDGTTVKIGSSTGSDLLVRQTPGNTSTPLVPLTLATLKDPKSPYFAKLDAASGRITNASTLGLTTAGVGTGQTGLPIAQHQLGFVAGNNGFYEIYHGGEKTTDGNAGISGNFNSDYTIQGGPLKNVSLGGALQWRQDVRRGYTQINGVRAIYYDPDSVRFDLRISYARKIGRYQWQTQFNVRNVLNQYSWVRVLNADGTLNNARTSELPRGFAWTNSIRF
jgi:hypothetical protein